MFIGAILFCLFLYKWLKNSKFLDSFIKDTIIDKEFDEVDSTEVMEDIKSGKQTLRQKAVDNKEIVKQAKKDSSKINSFLDE